MTELGELGVEVGDYRICNGGHSVHRSEKVQLPKVIHKNPHYDIPILKRLKA